ncbi:UbiH/UbiF/VisC/COQ6 family ubiquinone biosynthesis hydroxylase [Sphingobium yanoikuyae]|jgi:2-octaprenyl-6-methoxyphenol hydroxylase|uniref:Ubiquinone biosynthesis protein UbiH n=1 Tax=Sphingobium yanoikuyae TaxID=13690 RepID=A0A085K6F4_SPHYA|nr:UbiH/UbiF/VisC/COQ6 family ubiquinone biosynthesis hydroxylase [Sphingobium yanoikuyae]AYO80722.1 ubiquinone biosynthesis protein UbiH [Sphingobium yanoikuyae]KFD28300.1 ubiquinone biosynthesis protein UbiH [Sphingobium yanoikuyae]KZC76828.1 ubiquinone biosynthesis protein UbiH [Sphingobium yanoikuyae]MDV3480569.1 UbiH/UbiF/VisC/COQ6 family ubiquinone biosynthesis hydroxylase [Sphingobium yanoikuyae]
MQRFDVVILGGGLVGLTLGIALSRHGVQCAVIDPADPVQATAAGFDGRVSAISSTSHAMLQAIGVGAHLEGKGCPIDRIWVSDGLEPGALDFVPDADDGVMGTMFPNRDLRVALAQTAAEVENLTLFQPDRAVHVDRNADGVTLTLQNGAMIHGALLVAAEGRNSPTREAAGINTTRWQYKHTAMVTAIDHEVPHANTAYEIFYVGGPLALLPMLPGTRSAVVWTVPTDQAPAMLKLSERAWLAEMQKRIGGFLGEISLAGPRSSYPLGFHHAARITDTRLALVGDSAHAIHPIAGQGLNLGFRDVAALVEVLVEGMRLGLDPGDAQLLARYQRWRGLDTMMTSVAMDGLVRLFDIPGKLPSLVRRAGLAAVQRTSLLKNRFMAEARGQSGALPRLLAGEMV